MFDPNKLLGDLLGGQDGKAAAKGGFGGSFAGGLAGTVLGNVLSGKGGKKLGKNAVKLGGLAVVGGVAYAAYNHYRNGQKANAEDALTPPPANSRWLPGSARDRQADAALPNATPPQGIGPDAPPHAQEVAEEGGRAALLLRAMIAAAKADGQIDGEEQRRIFERLGEADLDADARRFLVDELGKPLDMDGLVAAVDGPEAAAEVYAASLLAIEVDTAAERGYLQMLSARLGLEDGLAGQLEAEVAAVKAAG
jgi:uncharacterized membrane protein YebE (DUF533 family)